MIKKIKNYISNNLQKDKLLHLILGSICYSISSIFLEYYYSLSIVLLIGIMIEIIDKISKNGTYDHKDIIYTFIGGLICLIVDVF